MKGVTPTHPGAHRCLGHCCCSSSTGCPMGSSPVQLPPPVVNNSTKSPSITALETFRGITEIPRTPKENLAPPCFKHRLHHHKSTPWICQRLEQLPGLVGVLWGFYCRHVLDCWHLCYSGRLLNSHFLVFYFLQVSSIKLDILFILILACWLPVDKETRCRAAWQCLMTFPRKEGETLGRNW